MFRPHLLQQAAGMSAISPIRHAHKTGCVHTHGVIHGMGFVHSSSCHSFSTFTFRYRTTFQMSDELGRRRQGRYINCIASIALIQILHPTQSVALQMFFCVDVPSQEMEFRENWRAAAGNVPRVPTVPTTAPKVICLSL